MLYIISVGMSSQKRAGWSPFNGYFLSKQEHFLHKYEVHEFYTYP